jgi:hypothetical protein
MKHQLIIEVEGKPSCEKCKFYEGANGHGSISCKISGYGYCISDLLDNCKFKPKKELEPKQLSLTQLEDNHHDCKWFLEISKQPCNPKNPFGITTIGYIITMDKRGSINNEWVARSYFVICKPEYQCAWSGIQSTKEKALEIAIQQCKEHYNKLFKEMIGE